MKTTFYSMVMDQFKYLIPEYGFVVKKVEESKRSPQTEVELNLKLPPLL